MRTRWAFPAQPIAIMKMAGGTSPTRCYAISRIFTIPALIIFLGGRMMTPHLHRKGARIACPFCIRPTGRRECPCITGGISPARRADKKEETYGFLLLANHPLSLRRATGAVYRSPAKRMPPICCCDRQGLAATPEGQGFPFLLLLKSGRQFFSVTHLCARQRALICGSKCRKFSGRRLCVCFYLEGKGVIRKRGETPGFAPLREPQRACMRATARRAALSES